MGVGGSEWRWVHCLIMPPYNIYSFFHIKFIPLKFKQDKNLEF